MDLTLTELAGQLGSSLTSRQVGALVILAGIDQTGFRHTGRSGRPAPTYDSGAVTVAYEAEKQRTSRPFVNSDWIAHALLARNLIRAGTDTGAIWRPDGTRAETLGTGCYGWVRVGTCNTSAHRLIWIAADGEIPPGLQVNHVNKRRWDNRRANLELVTHRENMRHAHQGTYLTVDEATRQLAELGPPEEPDPWRELMRAPGGEPAMPPGTPIKSQVNRSRVRRH
jgi:hypothetical protein